MRFNSFSVVTVDCVINLVLLCLQADVLSESVWTTRVVLISDLFPPIHPNSVQSWESNA